LRLSLNDDLKNIGAEYNRNYPMFVEQTFRMIDVKVSGDTRAKRRRTSGSGASTSPTSPTSPLTEEERDRAKRISEKKRKLAADDD
jgi:hypothetical protein